MKLSVVLPCHNAEATIEAQLEALSRQEASVPWELLVVNNRSTDTSLAIVEDYSRRLPVVRVVNAPLRQGQAYARNEGVKAARGESILFCDADDLVGEGWLTAMNQALVEHAFVACRLDFERLNPPWLSSLFVHHGQRSGLQAINYFPFLPHAGGGTIGVRRDAHLKVGGFDESLAYVEDTDYCFRLQLSGVELHFVPDAVVHVRLRQSLLALFWQGYNWAEYNMRNYKKHAGSNVPASVGSWKNYNRRWRQCLTRMARAREKTEMAKVIVSLGWQLGLLKGSWVCRLPPI